MDMRQFDPYNRDNNNDEISLFTFDIINSLGQKQKDFLIHARLAHLPRKAILQLLKNGATGLPFKGKFKELCRPCLESHQRAGNHGKQVNRHPNGKIGEHLHSDLAVVNLKDYKGFKYVLTVVDEISDEVVVSLLKVKTAAAVLEACRTTLKIITARNKSTLKTWQFDRGSEFLNKLFEDWITNELGATQLFSNIEHPWENGRAERSFSTIFQKARAMLKYADLPNNIWGKAVMHAVYLKNRCPSTRLNLLSPLQFRTGKAQDFTKLRVFGCPAQIFIRPTKRENNKLSDRSEKGTLIGMSRAGNGYIFKIQRTNEVVEIDSKDVKFNETFSDCMDLKGKTVKGGRVLDPDLFNVPEMAADLEMAMEKWKSTPLTKKPSRFETPNQYEQLQDNDSHEVDKDEDDEIDNNENEPEHSDDNNTDDDSSEHSSTDDHHTTTRVVQSLSTNQKKKPLDEPIRNKRKNFLSEKALGKPMKAKREIKNLLSSQGFVGGTKTLQETLAPSSLSKRKIAPPPRLEPSFEPTYKRGDKTMFVETEEDELTNLNPTENAYDQLLTCMEQSIKTESGILNDSNEDSIHQAMNDIGGADPKSQKAIDRMPEKHRQRYNEATKREYEGMKNKDVMEFVRMSDIQRNQRFTSVLSTGSPSTF